MKPGIRLTVGVPAFFAIRPKSNTKAEVASFDYFPLSRSFTCLLTLFFILPEDTSRLPALVRKKG